MCVETLERRKIAMEVLQEQLDSNRVLNEIEVGHIETALDVLKQL